MTTRDTDWDGVRLHVVTGKGGTGKTTVAAALALALASAGRRVWTSGRARILGRDKAVFHRMGDANAGVEIDDACGALQ